MIVLLECMFIKYEKVFISVMRYVEKAEYRSESIKIVFDYVCVIFEFF